MSTLGAGSDQTPFIFYAGIPSINIWFRRDKVSLKRSPVRQSNTTTNLFVNCRLATMPWSLSSCVRTIKRWIVKVNGGLQCRVRWLQNLMRPLNDCTILASVVFVVILLCQGDLKIVIFFIWPIVWWNIHCKK